MSRNHPNRTPEWDGGQGSLPARLGASRRGLILWSGVVVLSLVVGGYAYFLRESRVIRREQYDHLKAITDLKVGQFVRWRKERAGDARTHANRSLFRTVALEPLEGSPDRQPKNGLREPIELLCDSYGYSDVILARADGTVLFSLDPHLTALDPITKDLVARTIASREVEFGDFFRCAACDKVHLDVAASIQDAEGRAVAAIVLRSDPEDYLYPLLQSWPFPSRSAETLIVRKDGDDVLFLNRLRHVPDPPLTLRIPLSKADLPAVRAASGEIGECEGIDYRGVKVLADVRAIPNSPWFMVAKVDASEILAAIEYRAWVVFLFVVLSTLIAGGVAALVFHNGRRALFEDLYHTERRRREAQEEIRTTLYSIGDAVITTDAAGRVTRMNPVAERLTGWPEAEALGQPLDRVFCIVNEETRAEVENPVTRVMRDGVVVGLANHTSLLARDGAEHPIADSGAPIRDEEGHIIGVVLVFRDQTEQRQAERAIQTERDNLRALLAASPVGIFVLDDEELVVDANPAAERMLGTSLAELKLRRCGDLIACVNRHQDPRGCGHSANCPDCALFAAARNALVAGQSVHDREIEVVREFSDGPRSVWFTFSVEPVSLTGRRNAVVALDDITDRKESEESLRRERDFAESLVETAQAIVLVLDPEGRIVRFNPYMEEISGYRLQEVEGEDWFSTFLPQEDLETIRTVFSKAIGGVPTRGYVNSLVTKDGARREIEWHDKTLKDSRGKVVGLVAIGQDITERRRAERTLRESEERHRSLVMCSVDAVLMTSPDGGILAANEAACRMFGRSEEELIRGGRASIVDESDPRLAAALEERARTGRFRGELTMVRKDGTKFPAELSSVIFADREGNPRTSTTIRDLTDRKRAEEDLREANARLSRALAEARELAVHAEAANRAKSEFLANMSHEIRTPMTAILGFSELLSSSPLSPGEQRQFLEGIHRNGEALMSLLNDILDLSRIEAGRMTAELTEYPLRQIMEDVMAVVRLRAEEKGLSLEVDYATEVPETVHTDPARLRQILVNLVGNAVKYTDQGEVRIAVRCTGETGSPERLEFAVSDTGIGIPAERIACLFQPFTQADTSSTRLFGGAGLGLAISKRLAAMLGGGIEVVSESGKGSTFTLAIENAPLAQATPAGPVAAGGRSPETRRTVLQGRVLLAEDMPDVQRAVTQILRTPDLEVEIAKNGLAACRMAERSKAEGRPYDVVLMDIRMPEMDGYEATQWLRQHGWEGPIVALTAYALASDREKCLAAGCSDYLSKPFTTEQLEEVLARYLTR